MFRTCNACGAFDIDDNHACAGRTNPDDTKPKEDLCNECGEDPCECCPEHGAECPEDCEITGGEEYW